MHNTTLSRVQAGLSPVSQWRFPERPPSALMLGLQPTPKFPRDILIHLPKMLGGIEPAEVGRPSPQYRVEPVQPFLQRRAVITADSRLHLIPNPLPRAVRRPAVAKPTAGIAPRSLFPKVHPQKVEAILCIDNASLVFIDSHPQPRQELPQLRHVYFRGLPSAQHHQVIRIADHLRRLHLPLPV